MIDSLKNDLEKDTQAIEMEEKQAQKESALGAAGGLRSAGGCLLGRRRCVGVSGVSWD